MANTAISGKAGREGFAPGRTLTLWQPEDKAFSLLGELNLLKQRRPEIIVGSGATFLTTRLTKTWSRMMMAMTLLMTTSSVLLIPLQTPAVRPSARVGRSSQPNRPSGQGIRTIAISPTLPTRAEEGLRPSSAP